MNAVTCWQGSSSGADRGSGRLLIFTLAQSQGPRDEPRRLAHRYMDNTIFVAHTVRQLTAMKSYAREW
jgi:predicted hydrolase (HD superfamily)